MVGDMRDYNRDDKAADARETYNASESDCWPHRPDGRGRR